MPLVAVFWHFLFKNCTNFFLSRRNFPKHSPKQGLLSNNICHQKKNAVPMKHLQKIVWIISLGSGVLWRSQAIFYTTRSLVINIMPETLSSSSMPFSKVCEFPEYIIYHETDQTRNLWNRLFSIFISFGFVQTIFCKCFIKQIIFFMKLDIEWPCFPHKRLCCFDFLKSYDAIFPSSKINATLQFDNWILCITI